MQVGDYGACNIPAGCLVEVGRIKAGLPDVVDKEWISSPFDGSPTWNCNEDAPYWVELNHILHPGPSERRCEVHARACQYLADQGRLVLVRIWDRRTGETVHLETHIIEEVPW